MVVTKTDYSLQPPWTYNELRDKYMEILQEVGVMGVKLDEFTLSGGDWVVHKRTYNPTGNGTIKYPHCYYMFRILNGVASKVQWFTSDGSWDAENHAFVAGANDPESNTYMHYYLTDAANYSSTNYQNKCWSAPANTNELLPIYLYRSQEDPNFYFICIDDGAQGVSTYLPASSTQLDPMIQLDQLYLFPDYRWTNSNNVAELTSISNSMNFSLSYNFRGYGTSSYNIWSGRAYQEYGDNDQITFRYKNAGNYPHYGSGFSMPDIYWDNFGTVEITNKQFLIRGAQWSNWMKNKQFPSDFAVMADYGVTSQTRLGQPYLVNGNRYEVAAVSQSTISSLMILAQITE